MCLVILILDTFYTVIVYDVRELLNLVGVGYPVLQGHPSIRTATFGKADNSRYMLGQSIDLKSSNSSPHENLFIWSILASRGPNFSLPYGYIRLGKILPAQPN